MAIREIRMEPDPILRKRSREVTEITPKIIELLDDMAETLIKSDAIGIAAVQVGMLKRIFLTNADDKLIEIINPEIVESSGSMTSIEACLSIDKKVAYVTRPNKIRIKGLRRTGEPFEMVATGELAVVMCHELDHLNGILFTDRKIEPKNEKERQALEQYGTPA